MIVCLKLADRMTNSTDSDGSFISVYTVYSAFPVRIFRINTGDTETLRDNYKILLFQKKRQEGFCFVSEEVQDDKVCDKSSTEREREKKNNKKTTTTKSPF